MQLYGKVAYRRPYRKLRETYLSLQMWAEYLIRRQIHFLMYGRLPSHLGCKICFPQVILALLLLETQDCQKRKEDVERMNITEIWAAFISKAHIKECVFLISVAEITNFHNSSFPECGPFLFLACLRDCYILEGIHGTNIIANASLI